MAIAILIDAPGDAHPGAYDAVNEKMDIGGNPPDGLIMHTAGHAPDGSWRIFDVWESQEDFDKFNEKTLGPALREVIGEEMAAMEAPRREVYELYNVMRP
jgi:hypothetical protein